MLLTISHRTEYHFAAPVYYALQQIRLTPRDSKQQKVLSWSIEIAAGTREAQYADHYGNMTDLISTTPDSKSLEISVIGQVETSDTAGVYGKVRSAVPLWLYRQTTELTEPGEGIQALAKSCADADDKLSALHDLSSSIQTHVAYKAGTTGPETTAEKAFAGKQGVCQDHAHIFIAAARAAGLPARYVSGYLLMDDRVEQEATHAWAEAYVEHLGWVGFDVSNGHSPDERYVRVASGLDYRDAAPVSGLRQGNGEESLIVSLQVQQ